MKIPVFCIAATVMLREAAVEGEAAAEGEAATEGEAAAEGEAAEEDCSCTIFINTSGFGQCKKGDSKVFDGDVLCYVNLPSNCTDLVKSTIVPGMWVSAEACTLESALQFVEDGPKIPVEVKSFYELNAGGHLECNTTDDCPLNTSDPFNCDEEEKDGEVFHTSGAKDGEVFHTCSTKVYQYKCQLKESICTESICTKKCYSGGEYSSHDVIDGIENSGEDDSSLEIIDGIEYSCVEECDRRDDNSCIESGSVLNKTLNCRR